MSLSNLSLDVGCGGNEEYPYRGSSTVNIDISIPNQKLPNFIRSDAHHIPFRQKIFSNVLASHILEHCTCPVLVIHELLRICDGKLIIKVPHWLSPNARRDPSHLCSFRPRWFNLTLRKYNPKTEINYRRFLGIIGIPDEIACEVDL